MPNPPYPLHPEPMQKNWLERNPRWKIPLGCLILFFLLGVFVAVLFTVITASFRSSDVYKQAMAKAAASPQVRQTLGEPIRQKGFMTGELHINGSTGDADLSIPIRGPRGKATVRAVAKKSDGVWRFSWLQVCAEGQDSGCIDLLSIQPPVEREF
ncbi:MAG TPA: cytochrome c oxidase assembly factor Coa1 family protein [Candidatus Solibacter sp.]|nr:cytochrome c oxidase assembly factor Coa1 family protein [Candidatus Solibacter sp.]